jgi:hypothetical protein|tara:strand:- start:205 stop:834 length:630 start_codon:yes stop_codon:yes gene_type:complete
MAIVLTDSIKALDRKIGVAIASIMNKRVKQNKKRVLTIIQRLIPIWVTNSPEIISLLKEGEPFSLNAQIGLPPGQAAVFTDNLVEAIISSIEVKFTGFTKDYRGGVEFSFQPAHFRNLLGIRSTDFLLGDRSVNWLHWLIKEGDTIIMVGYHYEPEVGEGRSGGGIMQRGDVWRIPPEFSGVDDNNFVTRLFDNRDKQLATILPQMLKA